MEKFANSRHRANNASKYLDYVEDNDAMIENLNNYSSKLQNVFQNSSNQNFLNEYTTVEYYAIEEYENPEESAETIQSLNKIKKEDNDNQKKLQKNDKISLKSQTSVSSWKFLQDEKDLESQPFENVIKGKDKLNASDGNSESNIPISVKQQKTENSKQSVIKREKAQKQMDFVGPLYISSHNLSELNESSRGSNKSCNSQKKSVKSGLKSDSHILTNHESSKNSFKLSQKSDLLSNQEKNTEYTQNSDDTYSYTRDYTYSYQNTTPSSKSTKTASKQQELSDKIVTSKAPQSKVDIQISKLNETLNPKDSDYYNLKREEILNKWKQEAENAAKEERMYNESLIFKVQPNKYKITGIRREQKASDSKQISSNNEEVFIPQSYFRMPPNPSNHFLRTMSLPTNERLSAPKKKKVSKNKSRRITKREFDEFYNRQCDTETKRMKETLQKPKSDNEEKVGKSCTTNIGIKLFKESIKPFKFEDDEMLNENIHKSTAKWTNDERFWKPKEVNDANSISIPLKTKRNANKNSILMTKGKSSFFERSKYDYSDVLNKYKETVEKEQMKTYYTEFDEKA
ncbi:hypothetical protein TVAG_373320 [Trichomonas vaginalis G3]|uniref:Uncharacterized protein n=1 Tax=Trichomonas vaginalis (strain ATCC PRA-98 / G3) TaxID=412133 RepID=A2DZJ5_TRIV3|nr:hypothetical protein TVAGG3_0012000 [Trichomonas vaginalis G3]EAY14199.1 hypothetical protein TVAG_373320 [Trichomonas vaginalis G3]KAI5539194.1 hypothetical protein TVAGG3_0012000 [Trichomonas vaginalis G3]|eukprot:XP_001326422.1 hypothetical protein [Trichomonas vaginalis G3]